MWQSFVKPFTVTNDNSFVRSIIVVNRLLKVVISKYTSNQFTRECVIRVPFARNHSPNVAISKITFHRFMTRLAINVIIVKRVIPNVAISTLMSSENIKIQQMSQQLPRQHSSIVFSVVIVTYRWPLIINTIFSFILIMLVVLVWFENWRNLKNHFGAAHSTVPLSPAVLCE
jgi:hypothetical protein